LDVSGNGLVVWTGSNNDFSGISALAKSISNLRELKISNNNLQAEGASILVPAIQDMGLLSKFTFSGDHSDSKPVTVEVGMTEADFSGAVLQQSGAIILAAWLKHKVHSTTQTNQCWFGLIVLSIRTRGRCHH
jgi:hypothetical protein